MSWERRALRVRRNPNDRHPQIGANPDRIHVFRHLLARSHAGVITLGDDVGQALIDDNLDLMSGYSRRNFSGLARALCRRRNQWP
jgi:hypothetical protein